MNEEEEPWEDSARCAETDPDLFFPVVGADHGRAAKKVCGACDVRTRCLAFALTENIGHGVWGGLTADERKQLTIRARRTA